MTKGEFKKMNLLKKCFLLLLIVSVSGCHYPSVQKSKVDEFGLISTESEGITKSYYANGQLAFEGEYKHGKAVGEHIYYYENGQISRKGTCKKDGSMTIANFSQDGQHLLTETIYQESKYKINFKNGYLYSVELNDKATAPGDLLSAEIRVYNPEGFLIKKIKVKNGKDKLIYEKGEI